MTPDPRAFESAIEAWFKVVEGVPRHSPNPPIPPENLHDALTAAIQAYEQALWRDGDKELPKQYSEQCLIRPKLASNYVGVQILFADHYWRPMQPMPEGQV